MSGSVSPIPHSRLSDTVALQPPSSQTAGTIRFRSNPDQRRPVVPTTRPRSLLGYLVMPRPRDLVKGLLIPAVFTLGAIGPGTFTTAHVLRMLIVTAVVELLIYPARYQWNDIRGFAADQHHPNCIDRGRLPGPLSQCRNRIAASGGVAIGRLVVAAVLAIALSSMHLGGILAFAGVGVFAVAAVYEWLRSNCTGRTGSIPAPVSSGVVALWLTVGAGYVVRGMTGLALAIPLSDHIPLAAATAFLLWAYGIAFVTSRWAVEATAFARFEGGLVRWQAHAGQAREHLLALVPWIPAGVAVGPSAPPTCREWCPLTARTSLLAPWNLAMVAAGGAAGCVGMLLSDNAAAAPVAMASAAGVLSTMGVLTLSRFRTWAAVAAVALLFWMFAALNSTTAGVSVVPWAAVAAAYLFFSGRSMLSLSKPSSVARPFAMTLDYLGRLLIGGSTWTALRGNDIHHV